MSTEAHRFPKIEAYILFGGGMMLATTAVLLKNRGYEVLVVTSRRHADEVINTENQTLVTFLKEQAIPCHISSNVNTDPTIKKAITSATMGLSICAAWIFKADFIDLFGGRLVNLHEARLPHNRGGGAASWLILSNNRLSGTVLHELAPGVDTGRIILYDEFVYPPSCVVPADYARVLTEHDRNILTEFIDRVEKREGFQYAEQQENFSIYWPRLSTLHQGFIDWSWKLDDLILFIRAFDTPYPGASTFVGERRVFLSNCSVSHNDGTFHPFQAGIIYRKSDSGLFVATPDGTLIVGVVKDEAGKDLMAHLNLGDCLYTPMKFLEEAKMRRIIYTPEGLKKS